MATRKAQINFFLILIGIMVILLQQGNAVAAQNAPTEDNEVVINIKVPPPPDDIIPVDPCCIQHLSCCRHNPSNGRKLFSKVL
ncbi:hypothetical protein IEQ34_013583 [Dendrobium chrysotoxum]|uniref:Uncharacterized protein n=1 Tax=Dendrobium chrysotoxum TaxID=161865 RepID=A0AAV7GRS9_DENCH|nr:hypothetical protein IEQ34_013583 [Dendrobium chrysotoxum]